MYVNLFCNLIMQHAIDINGKKIRPASSGQIAFCGFCGEKVRGRCGEINIWHWQHINKVDCDSWKEGETEWHRAWKSRFPFDWQETIIIKNGEKHIADIFTDEGLVIEFQNSAISPSTIAEREKFYGKMIWVINAESFKNNLVTENVSEKHLAEIEKKYAVKRIHLKKYDSISLESIKKKPNLRTAEIQILIDNLNMLESVTAPFTIYNKNAHTFAEQIINIWQNDNLSVDPSLIKIITDDALISKNAFLRLRGDFKLNNYHLDLPGKTSSEIEQLYLERKNLLAQRESLKALLFEELKSVASKYLNLEGEITHLKNVLSFLNIEKDASDKELQNLKAEIDYYINTNLQILEDAYIEEKNNNIKDKDKLNFIWKRERKSWLTASAQIYFDLGDGRLLYKHSDNKVIYITLSDFISRFNPADS
ncbi:Competence protein CoiA-like family protein [Flavobacterium phragmitis]|uniref:Competence protein CoiA-like family protein n=2 Tax=Flavobacterium phragmitis TaxID=739143 RepID=A0A1I1LIU7_9FLAO|nr:Competence protein CoiA-like family protein [Flavobacterium phragmitis]